MHFRRVIAVFALGAAACFAAAQETKTYSRETTVQSSDGSKTITITGQVVKYEPGQTIVIREPNSRVVTYTIGPDLVVPTDIQIGRSVTITTEPSSSGPAMVTRITTTSVNSEGQTKTVTEQREVSASGQTKTTTTTVYGTVTAFEPGQSITIEGPNSKTVTYTIDAQSQIPQDLVVGKTVTVQTTTASGAPIARTVTITKTKTKTKVKD